MLSHRILTSLSEIGEIANAAEPETIASDSYPYYWNGHFVDKVGVTSTYIPKVAVVNQDSIVILHQTFALTKKLCPYIEMIKQGAT